MLDFALIIKTS